MKGATSDEYLSIKAAVSIHAPNEGSDIGVNFSDILHLYVSIHAPNEGSDGIQTDGR